MKSTLAKSVFVGLAALSVASVAQVNANAASKKSHAKTVSNVALTTDATTRNVAVTGKNAIFSYPKTVKKNARTVASKATVAQLAGSKKSSDYFRAYRVLKTSKGSIYYKVVSFDKKYRGYVYGGKTANKFDAGLVSAQTSSVVDLTTQQKAQSYYFKTPGKTNVTWTAPRFTQYGAKKLITDTSSYKYDALTLTGAQKMTKEGTLYYQVSDSQHPNLNGWIYSEALTTQAPEAANLVKINYKTVDGKVIKTSSYAPEGNPAVGTKVTDLVNKYVNGKDGQAAALAGTGYHYTDSDSYNQDVLKGDIKAGSSINLIVTQNQQKSVKVVFHISGTTADYGTSVLTAGLLKDGVYPSLKADQQALFTGVGDTAFSMANLDSQLTAAGKPLNKLAGKTETDGKTNTNTVYTYDKATSDSVNNGITFGAEGNKGTVNLYYTKSTTKTPVVTPAKPDNGNTDYVAK